MASKSVNLICIPSHIDPITYRVVFSLVNYIDSSIKPWVTLKDVFPFDPYAKYPYKISDSPDHLGIVGEFWLSIKKNTKRRDSIAQYIKDSAPQRGRPKKRGRKMGSKIVPMNLKSDLQGL